MKIAFVTALAPHSSTIIGRILPLARHLAKNHDVHLLVLKSNTATAHDSQKNITNHFVGEEPFIRTPAGKKRLSGWRLVTKLALITMSSVKKLAHINPDAVIIVKPLPHNVAAVLLWRTYNRRKKIILDVDDFELTANKLSSFWQRGAIHWAERAGIYIASRIIVATPFLSDRVQQITASTPPITAAYSSDTFGAKTNRVALIPTGVYAPPPPTSRDKPPQLLYIGSLSITSGHRVDMLPRILKKVKERFPKITLAVAGSGDDEQSLRKELSKHGLEKDVHFFGHFSTNRTAAFLHSNTILIDPIDNSLTQRAKSSFRVALAGAAGAAVVSSNIGIRPLLLPAMLHSRFFADASDPASYAEKIVALLNSPLTPREQKAMRAHAQSYLWHTLGPMYEDFALHP